MTYIQFIQQSWREKKEKNKNDYASTTQQVNGLITALSHVLRLHSSG